MTSQTGKSIITLCILPKNNGNQTIESEIWQSDIWLAHRI